jgi:hypothetical protein
MQTKVIHKALKLLSFSSSFAIVIALASPQAHAQRAGADTPKQSLAAQIRAQGYVCDQPLRARRDRHLSRPGRADWVLTCNNARYRILLDPGMAAQVTQIR